LWFSVAACVISAASALAFFYFERAHDEEIGTPPTQAKKLQLSDVKILPATFWLLCVICGLYYTTLFTCISNATSFLIHHYGYTSIHAGYIVGITYYMAVPGCPLTGYLVDKWGSRPMFIITGTAFTIPAFFLFCFTDLSPILVMILFGFAYMIVSSSLWPCIPLLVSSSQLGLAMGLVIAIEMAMVGTSNVLVGMILDQCIVDADSVGAIETDDPNSLGEHSQESCYFGANLYFLASGTLATILSLLLLYKDLESGGVLRSLSGKGTEFDKEPMVECELTEGYEEGHGDEYEEGFVEEENMKKGLEEDNF